MKSSRALVLLLTIAITILILSPQINASITGYAVSQTTNVSIVVVAGTPSATILSPRAVTYLTTNITLNFTTTNSFNSWYSIDNGPNTTITSPSSINLTSGQHNLSIFVNNTDGLTARQNVTFTINTSRLNIQFSNYEDQGNTTDFLNYGHEELQNLTNVILERQSLGKISFNSGVNVTDASNTTSININSLTNISQNYIYINSDELPGFNRPATLVIRNLSYSDPRILRNGEICSSTICTFQSYSGGELVFNVTQFSSYSSEETPASAPAASSGSSGGGGGGGGGGSSSATTSGTPALNISENEIIIALKQGEVKSSSFTITNNRQTPISFTLTTTLARFIRFEEERITIAPGESQTISFDVIARETDKSDTYVGKIEIEGNSIHEEILLAINLNSKNALMDVRISVPEDFQEVRAGQSIPTTIQLYNLGATSRIDVKIIYRIDDEDGTTRYQEEEELAVETQTSFVKSITIPRSFQTGSYIINVIAYYGDSTASSSAFIRVNASEGPSAYFIVIIILIGIITIILSLIVLITYRRQQREIKRILRPKRSQRFLSEPK